MTTTTPFADMAGGELVVLIVGAWCVVPLMIVVGLVLGGRWIARRMRKDPPRRTGAEPDTPDFPEA